MDNNNKRKLSGDPPSNVSVVIPPMRERESSSSSQGTAQPPSKKQKVSPKGKAVEQIEIPPVPQSKPSEMAKPRQGLSQNAQTRVAEPKAAQPDNPDSPPSQLPAAPVPQPPLKEIIHRLDRATSPGHVDDVPVILPVVQSFESNNTSLCPEHSSFPESEQAVRPPQYDRPVRMPSIPRMQQALSSMSPPNQPHQNQASGEIGLDASSAFVPGPILAPPPQKNTATPAPLNRSPQSVNWNRCFPMPEGPVVIDADSLSLEEAELFSRLYYIFMRTPDTNPNKSQAEARILSLLQRWHGVADIAANEDDTFSIRRGIHVGNGISYACISLGAKALLAGIGTFFQNMVHSINRELASMPLVELRDSHDLGMINYFHLQKLDKAFLWSAAARMHHHCRSETIIPEDIPGRAAVAAGTLSSALPRTSRATSSSGAASSSNTPNNSGFYRSSHASAYSSATPASSLFDPAGGSGTSPNAGILNSEGVATLPSPGGGFLNF